MSRPATLVFVAGTATDVGKTWWSAAVLRVLRARGVAVAARKPVQSGDPGATTDATVLAAATGEDAERVCPPDRTYPIAWAPPMAATAAGAPTFTVDDLVATTTWPDGTTLGLVEGVGGPRSPMAHDGDNVAFARVLAPDAVLLVADAGLGTINAVRLAAGALDTVRAPLLVALNRFDDDDALHAANRAVLEADGLVIVVTPDACAAWLCPP